MIIDEKKAEYLAILLTVVGLYLTMLGIDGPLIAGSVLCGAIMISRRLGNKGIKDKGSLPDEITLDEQSKCEPVDADNPGNPPENSKNQLDD